MRLRKLFGQAIDVVEVAVRLVFVLFVQFSFVEALVVKLCRLRSGGLWSWSSSIVLD